MDVEMEFNEEFTDETSRERAGQIIKGKRTKRQRSCTSGNSDCLIESYAGYHSTEEDEDMANCLIMLAHSVSPAKEEIKSDQNRMKTEKLSSRSSGSGGGRSGFYVYECKTCNRTFPSFQALGGHRASHKKPKLNVEETKRSVLSPPLMEHSSEDQHKVVAVVEDEDQHKASMIINNNVQKSPSPPSFMIQTGVINNTKAKVHECSICGSEFLSGQALGGHMRKHRPTPPSTNRIGISTNTDDDVIEKSPVAGTGSSSMLSLDLNLPPPEMVDDIVQSKFQFTASSSQQRLVFSSPALVDCHY